MSRPQQLAAMLLAGAFLVGGVVGFALERVISPPTAAAAPAPARPSVEQLYDELALDPAQRAGMDSILDQRRRIMDSLLAPVRPRMRAVRDSFRAEVRARLSPDQQVRFDAYVARMRQQDEADRGDRR